MIIRTAVLVLTMALVPFRLIADGNDNPNAKRLLQISVTSDSKSPFLPWQQRKPQERFGYGVIVRKNVILTTETLVRNSKLIEITLPGSGRKLQGRKMLADKQTNLALIELLDEVETLPETDLLLADRLALEENAKVIQTDNTSAIQQCDGTVLQISMARVSDASFMILTYKLLTEPAVNSQGAPVFVEDKLAGITINHQRSDRECLMIPFPVIKRFLEDTKQPPYSGFPAAGFVWARLIDPAKRKFLGLPENDENGVQVLSTLPGSGAAEALEVNDVILSIDGANVDSLGYYDDEVFGRLLFSYLINGRRSAGESVKMTVLRNKKRQELTIPLRPWNDSMSLIPEDHEAGMNDYIVSGGMVLRELSGRYLKAHGGDWERRVGPRLAYYYETLRMTPEKPGDRIVVLAGVLPDTINIGYQNLRNNIITHINKKEIRNIDDVLNFVEEANGLHSIRLKSYGVDLAFDPEKLEEANSRILSSYRIPAINSRELKTMQENDLRIRP